MKNHIMPALRQKGCLVITMFIQHGEIAHMARRGKDVIQANFFDELSSPVFIRLPNQQDNRICIPVISGCGVFSKILSIYIKQ